MGFHREGDLNRLAWRQIETVKPGCGSTGEDCLLWKAPDGGSKNNVGVPGYGMERVITATESAPARTKQVIFRQPIPLNLLKIEGTRRQSIWNSRCSRHVPKSSTMHRRKGTLRIKGVSAGVKLPR
jgi:hypothetical protein